MLTPSIAAEAPLANTPAASPRLRIAFLSYRSTANVGGQGVFLSQTARALLDRGHSVDILSGPPYPPPTPGARIVELPSLDLYAQPHNGWFSLRWRHLASWTDLGEYLAHISGKFMEAWSFGRRAARYLAAHKDEYDVVLDNQTICYGLVEIEAMGLPVVGVIHHPIRRDLELALAAERKLTMRFLRRRWYSFLKMHESVAPRLKNVVVVSEASAEDVGRCLNVSRDVMSVAPLGVNHAVFKTQSDVVRRSNLLLTTASADVPLKGLPVLIEAYARLLPTNPDLNLVVIGKLREGPTKDLIARLGLTEKIKFRSGLTDQELAHAYAEATLFVSPSLYEGFGLPVAEAMACEAPVVTSDGGSLPEVVGSAGVIVPRGQPEALAEAIANLLADPERRTTLGVAGAARSRTLFRWEMVAERIEPVLYEAAARRC